VKEILNEECDVSSKHFFLHCFSSGRVINILHILLLGTTCWCCWFCSFFTFIKKKLEKVRSFFGIINKTSKSWRPARLEVKKLEKRALWIRLVYCLRPVGEIMLILGRIFHLSGSEWLFFLIQWVFDWMIINGEYERMIEMSCLCQLFTYWEVYMMKMFGFWLMPKMIRDLC